MKLHVNLPVQDLARSKRFFSELGFSFDPQFADENMEAMVVSDDVYVQLLVTPYFKTFIKKDVADATTSTETILALEAESRQQVDELVDKALAAGGRPASPPDDRGFLYQRSFYDPDGHMWELIWLDPNVLEEQG